MLISAAPRPGLRRGVVALAAAILVAAFPARAATLQDAAKLLKAGHTPRRSTREQGAPPSRAIRERGSSRTHPPGQGQTRERSTFFPSLPRISGSPEPYNISRCSTLRRCSTRSTHRPLAVYPHSSSSPPRTEPWRVYAKLASQALQGPADRFLHAGAQTISRCEGAFRGLPRLSPLSSSRRGADARREVRLPKAACGRMPAAPSRPPRSPRPRNLGGKPGADRSRNSWRPF